MEKTLSNEELIALAKEQAQTGERVVIGACQRIGNKHTFVNTCIEQVEHSTSPLIRSLARLRLVSFLDT